MSAKLKPTWDLSERMTANDAVGPVLDDTRAAREALERGFLSLRLASCHCLALQDDLDQWMSEARAAAAATAAAATVSAGQAAATDSAGPAMSRHGDVLSTLSTSSRRRRSASSSAIRAGRVRPSWAGKAVTFRSTRAIGQ